ncbi:MAG: bifunctional glycosyltransferase family 2/GtrA family protein [Dermatophilaceae bacterium]
MCPEATGPATGPAAAHPGTECRPAPSGAHLARPTGAVLDVVIPVYNEQHSLPVCIDRLDRHLAATFPYPYRITIADNASTDATWQVATDLAGRYPSVRAHHLSLKGRGRALKEVWLASDAPVLAYMDVDLSTDLDALWPLVAPLMSGHSDLAIGTRLSSGSRVVRGAYREFVSRSYNLILRTALGVRFSDAQCGFKAIRGDVARELLPWVQDTAWFFDTELLVLAERCRLRIHEVPVDWYDDPDSRVDVSGTARDDLAGVARLRRAFAHAIIPVDDLALRIGRGRLGNTLGGGDLGQVGRFAGVGLASTVIQLGLFAAMSGAGVPTQVANVLSLLLATAGNTWLNRRWAFGVRGRAGAWRAQLQGYAIFVVTWLLTAGALAVLGDLWPGAPTVVATCVVGVATAVSTGVKFVAFRSWMTVESPVDARLLPEDPDETRGAGGASHPRESGGPRTLRGVRRLEFHEHRVLVHGDRDPDPAHPGRKPARPLLAGSVPDQAPHAAPTIRQEPPGQLQPVTRSRGTQ